MGIRRAMSFHIVHILQHGSHLSIDRGFLVCEAPDSPERRAPFGDIRAVILAARGISFTGATFAKLLAQGAVLIHCDEHYQPIGRSVGLHRVVHGSLFEEQIKLQGDFAHALWHEVLSAKVCH